MMILRNHELHQNNREAGVMEEKETEHGRYEMPADSAPLSEEELREVIIEIRF